MMKRGLRSRIELTQPVVVLLVLLVVLAIVVVAFLLQTQAERGAITSVTGGNVRDQREIDKLTAEIRQIRSDTSGSLLWLKMAGVFVTVGAAVGGYLVGQTRTTRERAETERRLVAERQDFEHRQNIDATYHAIVQELSGATPLLRVASAMKLGKLLESPPVEWRVSEDRKRELSNLTKQVLAASLAIETDPKVLKALTIALALHAADAEAADLQGVDLSGARASDAYWARIDFRYADFYRANLTDASLRNARLQDAQFRETVLVNAVLSEADCARANFKLADLRGASLSGSDLRGANFENAKVYGSKLDSAAVGDSPLGTVDVSREGDGSETMTVEEWLARGPVER